MARTEFIGWRDQANANDLELGVNASDQLTYNGVAIASSGGALTGTTLTLSATSNQFIIGTTNTTTVSYTAPAASRVYTVPDAGGAANFILSAGAQTLTGAKTFADQTLLLQETGGTDVITINVASLGASRAYTLPDAGAAASFILTAGSQTITGAKTFANQTLLLQEVGSTDVITINVAALSASRAYTMPDAGGSADFVMTAGTQTIAGAKTFSSALTMQVNSSLTASSSGADLTFTVSNTSNTASSQSVFISSVGGTSAGDALYQAVVSGTTTFTWGIDNSASDAWVLSRGTALGTNDAISVSSTTSAVTIRGTTTNDSAATGFVGEYVESVQSTNTNTAADGVFDDLVSISLTAGDWDVTGTLRFINNGATWTSANIGVSSAAGNDTTGLVSGSNNFAGQWASSSTTPILHSLYVPTYRVSLTATTTYYLKRMANFSAGTPQTRGRLSARRVR